MGTEVQINCPGGQLLSDGQAHSNGTGGFSVCLCKAESK